MTTEWVLKIRPAFLAEFVKKCLRIERRVVETKAGFALFLDPASHFGNEVLKTGGYEPELTALIQTLLRPGDTFLDIGANEGFFSVVAARAVGAGRVCAVEPQSRLIGVVQQNLKLNHAQRAEAFHVALAETEGEITLQLTPNINTGASGIYKRWRWGGSEETVASLPLDKFAEAQRLNKVRLVKIDCEGAEPHILAGAHRFFGEHCAEFLSLDYHESIVGKAVVKALDAQVRAWGYELSKAANGCWIYHLPGLQTELSALGKSQFLPPL